MKLEELFSGTQLEQDATFSAPWEARAFAVALRLSESGICTWDEFRRHLIVEIGRGARVRAHGWVQEGDGYYTHFLDALENLLREKEIIGASALEARMRELGARAHEDHDH